LNDSLIVKTYIYIFMMQMEVSNIN